MLAVLAGLLIANGVRYYYPCLIVVLHLTRLLNLLLELPPYACKLGRVYVVS